MTYFTLQGSVSSHGIRLFSIIHPTGGVNVRAKDYSKTERFYSKSFCKTISENLSEGSFIHFKRYSG